MLDAASSYTHLRYTVFMERSSGPEPPPPSPPYSARCFTRFLGQNSAAVCDAGCGAVSMLALRVPAHAQQLIQMGAAEAVVQAMKIHPKVKQIQVGCLLGRLLDRNVLLAPSSLGVSRVESWLYHSAFGYVSEKATEL